MISSFHMDITCEHFTKGYLHIADCSIRALTHKLAALSGYFLLKQANTIYMEHLAVTLIWRF